VGPKRIKALLAHFGSLKRLRAASVEEIAAVDGIPAEVAAAVVAVVAPWSSKTGVRTDGDGDDAADS
jgi:excinuclease ABC subunit C